MLLAARIVVWTAVGVACDSLAPAVVPCPREFFDSRALADNTAPLLMCPRTSDHLWAPVMRKYPRSIALGCCSAEMRFLQSCPLSRRQGTLPQVWLLREIPSLGHMQKPFMALFSFLQARPRGDASVTVIWAQNPLKTPHASMPYVTQYAQPLLRQMQAFFRATRNVSVGAIDVLNTTGCWDTGVVWMHKCIWGLRKPLGSCGSWFARPRAVAAWRRFLAWRARPLPLHNCRAAAPRAVAVLVYDRDWSRRLKDPRNVTGAVAGYLRRAWPHRQVNVTYHQHHKGGTFDSQCALFGGFDLFVMVHGAGMANLVCARPCAAVVEIGWGAASVFNVLARQLLHHHCFVAVTPESQFTGFVMPANLTACLQRYVRLRGLVVAPAGGQAVISGA